MKKPATAANLRFRVRFDKRIETSGDGGRVGEWSTLGTGSFVRWADIRPLKGGEQVMQDRLAGTQPVIIIVRADSETRAVDPSYRAVQMVDGADGTAYALKTAQDMEMDNQFITVTGTAGDADS